MKTIVISIVLVGLFRAAHSFNNINVDRTCPIDNNCLTCLSRSSPDIERCQQLYFYVTNTNTGNQVEIDRYCNGDCPIILATANYFCSSSNNINVLLTMCPGYSVEPTGNLGARYNTSCLGVTGNCLNCLGNNRREAVRCFQLYMLASAANHTSKYANSYCERNCPTELSSYTWYCNIPSIPTGAYSYCQRTDQEYCGDLSGRFNSQLSQAAINCSNNCTSAACSAAISQYGCCLRSVIGDTCSRIPTCNLPVNVEPVNFNVADECPVSACSQCLARDNNQLERCEQQYTYLNYLQTTADTGSNVQSTFEPTVRQDFCRGECPILLLTSDSFCGRNDRSSSIYRACPTYSVIPSASVDIRAEYGRNRRCPVVQQCDECIASRSPEPTRCLQLFLLTFHPNQTDYYLNEYCPGNCPLTLSTSNWYCDRSTPVNVFFDRCMRRNDSSNTNFCGSLIARNQTVFNDAARSCALNCTSTICTIARNNYGCCLNIDFTVQRQCNIPGCMIMTAGAPKATAASFIIATLVAFIMYCFIN